MGVGGGARAVPGRAAWKESCSRFSGLTRTGRQLVSTLHPTKFNAIRGILEVAGRDGLPAAARQLDLTPPALTRSIQELGKEMQTTLFERGAEGAKPTPMGARFCAG